ncbi:MAG: RNA-directed DNA polymerase [archaeon GW2011_AR5]|nr:MAG: RNA-directed DNA polymerase [archaeon GW2011_AR5]
MNLYNQICSYDNLLLAYRKARKNKTSKWYVHKFEKELERNLAKLEAELRTDTYQPHPLKNFVIRDPKTRTISSSHFRDRVVHHAICNVIEPLFEKSFIHDSYASRKGKGTHAAIKRFDTFKRKASKNGRLVKNAKDGNMTIGYFLKADIRHYFETVDHEILLKILAKKINDDKVMSLIRKIVANHSTKNWKGMPIGNLTSQFFANIYLNELDKFVKHNLRARFYIRYLDDFVILHDKKVVLEWWKSRIDEFLKNSLKLELHPDKSKIYALHSGANFLGFRIFYHHKLLKKSNLRSMNLRMEELAEDYKNGNISQGELDAKISGWCAYAVHGNTYKIRNRIRKNMKKITQSL